MEFEVGLVLIREATRMRYLTVSTIFVRRCVWVDVIASCGGDENPFSFATHENAMKSKDI